MEGGGPHRVIPKDDSTYHRYNVLCVQIPATSERVQVTDEFLILRRRQSLCAESSGRHERGLSG